MKIAPFALALVAASALVQAQDVRWTDLDGGVSIGLSDGWKTTKMQNAAMAMPSMRSMMHGASETRLRKGDTGVLVSYMHFKSDRPDPAVDAAAQAAAEDITRKVGAQYLAQAVEAEVAPRSQITGSMIISLATMTAREGSRFNVAGGYPGGCVTTGSIRRGTATWAISVASDRCDTPTHAEAVEALFAARAA